MTEDPTKRMCTIRKQDKIEKKLLQLENKTKYRKNIIEQRGLVKHEEMWDMDK